jgi:hypothetical protein
MHWQNLSGDRFNRLLSASSCWKFRFLMFLPLLSSPLLSSPLLSSPLLSSPLLSSPLLSFLPPSLPPSLPPFLPSFFLRNISFTYSIGSKNN